MSTRTSGCSELARTKELRHQVFSALEELGPQDVLQLSFKLTASIAEIDAALRALLEDGLVERRKDPGDCLPAVTPAGQIWRIISFLPS